MEWKKVISVLEKGKKEVQIEEDKLKEAINKKNWPEMWKQLIRVLALSGKYLKICNEYLPHFKEYSEKLGFKFKTKEEILKEEGLDDFEYVNKFCIPKNNQFISDKKRVPKKMIVIPKNPKIM